MIDIGKAHVVPSPCLPIRFARLRAHRCIGGGQASSENIVAPLHLRGAPIVPPHACRVCEQFGQHSCRWRCHSAHVARERKLVPRAPYQLAHRFLEQHRSAIVLRVLAIPFTEQADGTRQCVGIHASHGALRDMEKSRHEQVRTRAAGIGLESLHRCGCHRRVGAQ